MSTSLLILYGAEVIDILYLQLNQHLLYKMYDAFYALLSYTCLEGNS